MGTRLAFVLLAVLVVALAICTRLLVAAGTATMLPLLLIGVAPTALYLMNTPNRPRG